MQAFTALLGLCLLATACVADNDENAQNQGCTPKERQTIFQYCLADFAQGCLARNMGQFFNSNGQCPLQVIDCSASNRLLTCLNHLPRNVVTDRCFAKMPQELTQAFRRFHIPCSYMDIHRKCASAWTGPLLQANQRPGSGNMVGWQWGNIWQQGGNFGAGQQGGNFGAGNQGGNWGMGQQGGNWGMGQTGANWGMGQQGGNFGAGQQGGNFGAGQQGGNFGGNWVAGQTGGNFGAGQQGGNIGAGQQGGNWGMGQQGANFGAGQQGGNFGGNWVAGQTNGNWGMGQTGGKFGAGQQGGNFGAGQTGANFVAGQTGGIFEAGQQGGNFGVGQTGSNCGAGKSCSNSWGMGQTGGNWGTGQQGGNFGAGQLGGNFGAGQLGGNFGAGQQGVNFGNAGSGACSKQESDLIFSRCVSSFAMSMGPYMQQFVNSRQCPRQLFNCQASTNLLNCANMLPRNLVSDQCHLQMATEFTKGFRRYRINCSYQDVHAQCAGAWTGPLVKPSQRPSGNGPIAGTGFGNVVSRPTQSGYGK